MSAHEQTYIYSVDELLVIVHPPKYCHCVKEETCRQYDGLSAEGETEHAAGIVLKRHRVYHSVDFEPNDQEHN